MAKATAYGIFTAISHVWYGFISHPRDRHIGGDELIGVSPLSSQGEWAGGEVSSLAVEPRAALGALVGGVLWAAKSLGILIADYEPEYAFAVAPFFFGIAALGVAAKVDPALPRERTATSVLAAVATIAGAAAALLYIATGDSTGFGLTIMVSVLCLLAVLIYGGWLVRQWSIIPFAIAATMLIGLPIGGALSEIDERLLEIPLLVVATGWILLGLTFWRNSREHTIEISMPAPAK